MFPASVHKPEPAPTVPDHRRKAGRPPPATAPGFPPSLHVSEYNLDPLVERPDVLDSPAADRRHRYPPGRRQCRSHRPRLPAPAGAPAHRRKQAIFGGVAGAILIRILLLFFALHLLDLPYLKVIGALLLLWIGIKLLLPEEENGDDIKGSTHLLGAIKTIIIADAVMSLDNVIALSAASAGDFFLVSLGVLISIPIIVWGSQLILRLIDRFPLIILFGGGLLGWIAGGMLLTDSALKPWLAPYAQWDSYLHYGAAAFGALFVILLGSLLARRQLKQRHAAPADAAESEGR